MSKPSGKWVVAVHGGAGDISRSTDVHPFIQGLNEAVNAGVSVLQNGHVSDLQSWNADGVPPPPLALAACLEAAEVLEKNELFNAGRGAVLNEAGYVENEASVMYGATRKSGAVCGRKFEKFIHPFKDGLEAQYQLTLTS